MDQDFQIFTTVRHDPQLIQISGSEPWQHAGWNYRTESPFYMFDFHRDRLLKAARYWKWSSAVELLSSEDALDELSKTTLARISSQSEDPVRVKILISRQGQVTVESGPTKPKAIENLFPLRLPPPGEPVKAGDPQQSPVFTLVLDTSPTAASAFTNYKTTRRVVYDAARQRAGIALTDPKEVLLVNEENNHIMEGTILTPYFWRNGRWVTPPVSWQSSTGGGSGGQDGTTRRWALER